ncbi:oligosaccharide flippase family protein [Listeria monocytogenes]|nr:oligosaccharide flippase family protein [Listeria monocytogenes]
MNNRKLGIVLSYGFILLNSVIGVLLTPFLLKSLGTAEYGVFQLIVSFSAYLIILDFGTTTTVTRYVSKYLSDKDYKGRDNYIATSLIISGIFSILIIIVGLGLFTQLQTLFGQSLDSHQIGKAKVLFILVMLNIAMTVFKNSFDGIILGHESFLFPNILKNLRVVGRTLLIVIFLNLGFDSISIVLIDIGLTIIILIVNICYCLFKLRIKVKLYTFDKYLFKDTLTFSTAIFLQSIVIQVNNNADKVLLGILKGPEVVALYSIAMLIFSVFFSVSSVNSLYLPEATRLFKKKAKGNELVDLAVKPGRMIAMFSLAILGGFFLCGRDFINLWVGEKYIDAWGISLIMMLSMIIPMVQTVMISILNAMKKRMFRSISLCIMAAINILLTIILVKKMGYMGAPIASLIATVIGDVIILNFYYIKILKLNTIRLLKLIFRGILISFLLSTVITYPIVYFLDNSWINLIIKIMIYIFISTCFLILFGLTNEEKRFLSRYKLLNKIR